jgi:predicted peptidase
MQTSRRFRTTFVQKVNLPYLLYLPEDYRKHKEFPLLLFLHGGGERGNNLELVKSYGNPKLIERGQHFPSIVVSPQCPEDSWWTKELEPLKLLINEIVQTYNVDKRRIYLTGLSMGGFGTFHLAGLYPKYFAAIAPICGGGHSSFAENLKDVPTWAFHGDKDDIVPIQSSQRMVKAIIKAGGTAKLTTYKNVKHNAWDKAYQTKELYKWLFAQHRA